MSLYEFELVHKGKTIDKKTMNVDTLQNARKYACWWIDYRNGYSVHICRKGKYGLFEYITPITYSDNVYYQGVFEKPISFNTGGYIRKKTKTKTNAFGLNMNLK